MKKLLALAVAVVMALAMAPVTFGTVRAVESTHTHDGIVFEASDTLPKTSGNYYLNSDIEIDETWIIDNGIKINLCLNGHGIKMTGESKAVIEIKEGGELNLFDCDTHTEHKYYIDDSSGKAFVARLSDEGDQVFVGGYITGGGGKEVSYSFHHGGGVYNKGLFTMHGGTIIGNINGPITTIGDYYYGGGVCVASNGKFVFDHGSIVGNCSCGYGGAVFLEDGAEFEMSGDAFIFQNNSRLNGGGVYVGSNTVFKLSGGKISNNCAKNKYGGGVTVNRDGKAYITGGEISNNLSRVGGGVVLFDGSTFHMSGGKIINNATDGPYLDGGIEIGIYTDCELSGDAEIYGNTNNGKPANVYLESAYDDYEPTVIKADNLSNKKLIGINMESKTGVFAKSDDAKNVLAHFKSDAEGLAPISDSEGNIMLTEGAWQFNGFEWTCNSAGEYIDARALYKFDKDPTQSASIKADVRKYTSDLKTLYEAILLGDESLDGTEHGASKEVTVVPTTKEVPTKKANTLSVKGKNVKVKYKKLKKKTQKIKTKKSIKFINKGKGKLSYKLVKVSKKKFKKYFKVNKKSGLISIKKKLKKGTYKVTVKVMASGDEEYNAITKKITVKVKVK